MQLTMGPIFTALHDPRNGLPRSRDGFSKTPPPKSKPVPKSKMPPEGVSTLLKAAGRITSESPLPSSTDPVSELYMLAAGRARLLAASRERNAMPEAGAVSETETASDQPLPPPAPPRVLNMFFAKDKQRAAQAVAAATNRLPRTENTDYLWQTPSYTASPAANGSRLSSRAASRAPPSASPVEESGRCRYFCRYPGCTKIYATTDGVRKHCRQQHNQWLKRLGPGCPDLYCRREGEGEGETPHDEEMMGGAELKGVAGGALEGDASGAHDPRDSAAEEEEEWGGSDGRAAYGPPTASGRVSKRARGCVAPAPSCRCTRVMHVVHGTHVTHVTSSPSPELHPLRSTPLRSPLRVVLVRTMLSRRHPSQASLDPLRLLRGLYGHRLRRVQVLPRQAQVRRRRPPQASVCRPHLPHSAAARRRWRRAGSAAGRRGRRDGRVGWDGLGPLGRARWVPGWGGKR